MQVLCQKKAPSKFFNKPSHYVIPAEAVRGMESIMGGFAKIKDQKNQSPT